MIIENRTPHAVHIMDVDGNLKKTFFPISPGPARLRSWYTHVDTIDGVPITKTTFGEPYNLPDHKPGTLLIVSQLIKAALPQRPDLVVPVDTVRDENGAIVGCKSLGI